MLETNKYIRRKVYILPFKSLYIIISSINVINVCLALPIYSKAYNPDLEMSSYSTKTIIGLSIFLWLAELMIVMISFPMYMIKMTRYKRNIMIRDARNDSSVGNSHEIGNDYDMVDDITSDTDKELEDLTGSSSVERVGGSGGSGGSGESGGSDTNDKGDKGYVRKYSNPMEIDKDVGKLEDTKKMENTEETKSNVSKNKKSVQQNILD